MEAIVLAGGLGTRLRSVVSDRPKVMAPIDDNGRPFLSFILDQLVKAGTTHLVLAVGYMRNVITDYYGKSYKGIPITYSIEEAPLGTGGAIKKALRLCKEDLVLVTNGDSYVDMDMRVFMDTARSNMAKGVEITVAAVELENFDRYGVIEIDEDDYVTAFYEKQYCRRGYISAGVYAQAREAMEGIQKECFSYENDYEKPVACEKKMMAHKVKGYFVDIGIPDDYKGMIDYLEKPSEM